MSDLISRQAAIGIASGYCHPANIAKELAKLPSAQPEIVHCEFCEHWKNEHLCECLSRHGTFETPKDFFCGYGKAK